MELATADAPGLADGATAVVLIVDDEPQIRTLIRNALADQSGLRVEAASDGEEGLLRAWELAPALILADLMMPGMDGATFCRLLAAHPTTAATRIVAVSAADPEGERALVLRGNCAAWIAKPFDIRDLLSTVRAHLAAVPGQRRPGVRLSRRQWEVAALIARGLTNRQIAVALVLQEGTVANHVRRILLKLGLRSRTQLAVQFATNTLSPGRRLPLPLERQTALADRSALHRRAR